MIVKVDGIHADQLKIVHTIMIAIATIVLTVSNMMVYVVAKQHRHFVRRNSYLQYSKEKKKSKSLKASYFCLAVVLNFIVFWAPHGVHDIIELSSSVHRNVNEDVLDIIVKQLTPLNSLTDPILFICLSTKTQHEIKKLLIPGFAMKRQLTEIVSSRQFSVVSKDEILSLATVRK